MSDLLEAAKAVMDYVKRNEPGAVSIVWNARLVSTVLLDALRAAIAAEEAKHPLVAAAEEGLEAIRDGKELRSTTILPAPAPPAGAEELRLLREWENHSLDLLGWTFKVENGYMIVQSRLQPTHEGTRILRALYDLRAGKEGR